MFSGISTGADVLYPAVTCKLPQPLHATKLSYKYGVYHSSLTFLDNSVAQFGRFWPILHSKEMQIQTDTQLRQYKSFMQLWRWLRARKSLKLKPRITAGSPKQGTEPATVTTFLRRSKCFVGKKYNIGILMPVNSSKSQNLCRSVGFGLFWFFFLEYARN